jgi:hypothetical protein
VTDNARQPPGARGPAGPAGPAGVAGKGFSRREKWFAVIMLCLLIVGVAGCLLSEYMQQKSYERGQQQLASAQASARAKQSDQFMARLCGTLKPLASLVPPPGSASDLSRQYLIRQHNVLAQLGPAVGCR